ncbi:hypothetical protein GGP41_001798 [Bipolaris sorokiniana]|uniref:Uncharacterized protein n=1 Tax=Cochliobolus sativus TaxID=45130 RepID=A0A8H5ZQ15_COCSA|nr:hypothetical protein GGP41_001798 [Bipolaris sorokiniana]
MHVRNLFLFGSLAMPIIAMPTSASNVVPRESVPIEQRGFSVVRVYRDLLKRVPLTEAIPKAASWDEVVKKDLEERGRPIKGAGGGPSKRDLEERGRPIKGAGGGPSKRDPLASGTNLEERGRLKGAGGGPRN